MASPALTSATIRGRRNDRSSSPARAFPPSARRAGLTLRAPCGLGAAQVKLLKLLASKMDKEEQECLPLLLNVFYYRETLFIVYELLRDNLYHSAPASLDPGTSGLCHASLSSPFANPEVA